MTPTIPLSHGYLSEHQRPTVAEISGESFVRNYQSIKKYVGSNVRVIAVIKSNAYGHGAEELACKLMPYHPDAFGVATLEEAIELRSVGVHAPIIILSGLFPWQVPSAVANDIRLVVYSRETALAAQETARAQCKNINIHVKIDTGMGRLGIHPDEVNSFADFLSHLSNLTVEGVMSHLATADENDTAFYYKQVIEFQKIATFMKERFPTIKWIHQANSASILRDPQSFFTAVRPGILLYGIYPGEFSGGPVKVSPVMQLKTRILHLEKHPAGVSLSYGRTFITQRESLIATIPVGYNDGIDRRASNKGFMLVRGHRAPIVGRVCMDVTLLDVTDIPGVALYDEVVIVGNQRRRRLTARDWADWLGTIPYEFTCHIGTRVPRICR